MLKWSSYLAFLTLVLLISHAFYVWSWGDDFIIFSHLKSQSVASFLWNDFMTFDGRSLNPGYFLSRFGIVSELPWITSLSGTVILFLTGFAMVYSKSSLQGGKTKMLFSALVVTALMWMASFRFLAETLYWQTGVLYTVECFLLILSYRLFRVALESGLSKIWVYPTVFLASLSSPGAVIALAVVLLIEYLSNRNATVAARSLYKKTLVVLCVGLMIVMFSPGSLNRFRFQGGLEIFTSFSNAYFRINQFISVFLSMQTPFTWLMLLSGLMAIALKQSEKGWQGSSIFYDLRWFLAALITVVFYLPKLSVYIDSPRVNSHFIVFLTMFAYTSVRETKFLQKFSEHQMRLLDHLILILFCVLASSELLNARFSAYKMEKRVALYRQKKGSDLVLKANDLIGPPTTRLFIDVQYDSSHLINRSVAEYYGLKSVRKEPYQ